MREGRVIKINAGVFTVKSGAQTLELSARGVLKIKSCNISAGDFVIFDQENSIVSVKERKNYFIRPNIANVDCINIVLANSPKPDFLMLDKLLLTAAAQNVQTFITVNKTDLAIDVVQRIRKEYSGSGAEIYAVSAADGGGLEELKERMCGKLVCFAGQSAVGKTSIINKITGGNARTGELSRKTERGRHTTTVTEITQCGNILVADTPGFSSFLYSGTDNVASLYPEFCVAAENCRFRSCTHTVEPDCAVKKLVETQNILTGRYSRYLEIYKELKEKRNNNYGKY